MVRPAHSATATAMPSAATALIENVWSTAACQRSEGQNSVCVCSHRGHDPQQRAKEGPPREHKGVIGEQQHVERGGAQGHVELEHGGIRFGMHDVCAAGVSSACTGVAGPAGARHAFAFHENGKAAKQDDGAKHGNPANGVALIHSCAARRAAFS